MEKSNVVCVCMDFTTNSCNVFVNVSTATNQSRCKRHLLAYALGRRVARRRPRRFNWHLARLITACDSGGSSLETWQTGTAACLPSLRLLLLFINAVQWPPAVSSVALLFNTRVTQYVDNE